MCSDSGCLLVFQAWRGGPGERPWDTGSQLCHLCYRQVLCLQCASSPGHAASCCPYSAARCPLRPCTQAAAQALPPDTWPGHGARPQHAAHSAREGPSPHTPLAPPRTLAQKPSPPQHQAHRAANTGAPRPQRALLLNSPKLGTPHRSAGDCDGTACRQGSSGSHRHAPAADQGARAGPPLPGAAACAHGAVAARPSVQTTGSLGRPRCAASAAPRRAPLSAMRTRRCGSTAPVQPPRFWLALAARAAPAAPTPSAAARPQPLQPGNERCACRLQLWNRAGKTAKLCSPPREGPPGRPLEHLLRLTHDARHVPLEAFPVLAPLLRRIDICGRLVVGGGEHGDDRDHDRLHLQQQRTLFCSCHPRVSLPQKAQRCLSSRQPQHAARRVHRRPALRCALVAVRVVPG